MTAQRGMSLAVELNFRKTFCVKSVKYGGEAMDPNGNKIGYLDVFRDSGLEIA